MDANEMAVYFTDDQFDKIIKWMEISGSETIQDAVMIAIATAIICVAK